MNPAVHLSSLPQPTTPHQLAQLHPVVGLSPWPLRPRQLWQPAISVPIPARFSSRALACGDQEAAAALRLQETAGERLASVAQPSKLNIATWEQLLRASGYPETHLNRLLASMQQGASIDPGGDLPLSHKPRASPNHLSTFGHAETVEGKLASQVSSGSLAVWDAEFPPLVISPLGLVQKFATVQDERLAAEWEIRQKRALVAAQAHDTRANRERIQIPLSRLGAPRAPQLDSKLRLIHDARFGINDRGDAPPIGDLDSLRSVVRELRPGDWLWVADLKAAFKNVKILPWQICLMAVAFLGTIFVDTTLTFGLNLAPLQYHACIAHPLLWLLNFFINAEGLTGRIFQYVDDHLGKAPSRDEALRLRTLFSYVCALLGIEIEPVKDQPVSQRARYLGFVIDTTGLAVLVICPEEKLVWIRERIRLAVGRGHFTTKELESLCGSIDHVAVAINGAAVFCSQLRTSLYSALRAGNPYVYVSQDLQDDISFWSEFASQWNGRESVRHQPLLPRGHLAADAMADHNASAIGIFAFGRAFRVVIDRERWASGNFPKSCHSIATLELIAFAVTVVIAAALFPDSMEHLIISGASDNASVLYRAMKGSASLNSSDNVHANLILKFVWRVSAAFRLTFQASWVASQDNVLCDAPSRDDVDAYTKRVQLYNSHTFSTSSSPTWWPHSIPFCAGPAKFSTCGGESALADLVQRLGTQDSAGLREFSSQMGVVLHNIRRELNAAYG